MGFRVHTAGGGEGAGGKNQQDLSSIRVKMTKKGHNPHSSFTFYQNPFFRKIFLCWPNTKMLQTEKFQKDIFSHFYVFSISI